LPKETPRLIYLPESLVLELSCLTCSPPPIYKQGSFCINAIRRGAIGYAGAVMYDWFGNRQYLNMLNNIYCEGESCERESILGKAFFKGYYRYWVTLLGDPTIEISPPYFLSNKLEWFEIY
jgi:hypothetical protein